MKTVHAAAGFFIFVCMALSAYEVHSGEYVPGQLIVKFKRSFSNAEISSLVASEGATLGERPYGGGFEVLHVPSPLQNVIMSRLRQHPGVAYAEPNYLFRAYAAPSDEFYFVQWNFPQIQVEQAWLQSTGENVVVAVIDTGINPHGRDGFGNRLLDGYNAIINRERRWEDFNFHGTHVAGTIGQETNNGRGMAGIAYDAEILPVKALNRYGIGTSLWLSSAIRWAADNGADIVNMSLGGPEDSRAVEEAVAYAYGNGVTLVAASGNESSIDLLAEVGYPASYDEVIAVGAVDMYSMRAYYSNGGPELDIVAPGGNIDVDSNFDGYIDGIFQETFMQSLGFRYFALGWNYYALQGTSMACPHVAGVAALVKSLHPDWSPDEIREALVETAQDLPPLGRDDDFGYGLVNAAAAVSY